MAEKRVNPIEELSAPAGGLRTPEPGSAAADLAALSGTAAPTVGEKAAEVVVGTAEGAAKGSAVLGGGLAGFRLGMAAAPFLGPFAPAGPIIGTGVGLTTGFIASQGIDNLFPGVDRQDLAPYREGGKTFGESIAFAPAAFGIPQMTANRVARFVSGIGEGARKYPKTFLTSEVVAGAGAGVGGGLSEAYAPGEKGTRFVSEAAGGFFAPGRFVINASGSVADFAGTLIRSTSNTARENRAANRLLTILNEAGEDVPALIRELEKPLPGALISKEVGPTAAQKTGSPVLGVLETTLARGNARYGAAIQKQGLDSIRAYELLIERLSDIGTPDAFRKAAELRQSYFNQLIDGRVALAEADAAQSIVKIKRDTPQARAEIGQIVRDNVTKALGDARDYERQLWTDAWKDSMKRKTVDGQTVFEFRKVTPKATGEEFLKIATDMTPERFNDLPTFVRSIMGRYGVTADTINTYARGKQTPEFIETGVVPDQYITTAAGPRTQKRVSVFPQTDVDDLIKVRSDLLAYARDSASKGEVANANFYGRMAEAVLKDLSDPKLKTAAYDKARDFSRTLNDYFTRTYANDVAAVTKKGADRLPPEILVQRAFGSAADTTALRMADIEDAVGMMKSQYDNAVSKFGLKSRQAQELKPFADIATSNVASIRDAQTRVLQLGASKFIDPLTNRVDPRRLQVFVNENKPMLDRMGLTNDLSDAVRAENALRGVEQQNSAIRKTLEKQTAFAQALKFENPTSAITDALNSRNPVKNFSNMVKLARTGGTDAVEGLKASLYDYAFTKAGGETNFSPAAFDKALFQPISPGQPSIFNILRSQNVLTLSEAKNLRRLIQPMERIEVAMKNNQLTDDVVQGADAVTELALRVIGSRIGSAVAPSGPGSLIAAGAGSKYMRDIFDKMPTLFMRGIIEKATQDPQFMALLLRRGQTEGDKFALSRQLHAYLGAAGLNYASFTGEAPPDPATQPQSLPPAGAGQMLRSLPPAPPTRGTLGVIQQGQPGQAPSGPAPAPAGGVPGPQSSNSRQMFQSLFPTDIVSSLPS
jgi:hypothetical protein